MKKIAIVQSNYIPWKGYFDLIASVDEFILFDEVQYTKRDWRNRNRIKTPQGEKWLTVPVKVKRKYNQKIEDTEIDGDRWKQQHWNSLRTNYAKATYYHEVSDHLFETFFGSEHGKLSLLNRDLIVAICKYLGIKSTISNSRDYLTSGVKSEKLIDICKAADADEYVSGPSAKAYIEETAFAEKNVRVSWFDYDNYRPYPQLWGNFKHQVTILDLLFNCGKNSVELMRYVKN